MNNNDNPGDAPGGNQADNTAGGTADCTADNTAGDSVGNAGVGNTDVSNAGANAGAHAGINAGVIVPVWLQPPPGLPPTNISQIVPSAQGTATHGAYHWMNSMTPPGPALPALPAHTGFWNLNPPGLNSVVQPEVTFSQAVVCVICGVVCKPRTNRPSRNPVSSLPDWMHMSLVIAKPQFLEWQKQEPRAVRTYHREGDSMIVELPVTEFKGGYSNIKTIGNKSYDLCTTYQRPVLPIHSNCFKVARKFCETQTQFDIEFRFASGGTAQNLGHLYEIWSKRAIAAFPNGNHTQPIPCPFDYLGAPFHTKLSQYFEHTDENPELKRYERNPMHIPNLTEIVMNELESMDGKSWEIREDIKGLWERVQSLPRELYERIQEHLQPFDADESDIRKNRFTRSRISIECSRIHTPLWWRDQFLSGKLIPWIFDLELRNVQEFRKTVFYHDPAEAERHYKEKSHVFDESTWDWELLVRQLAQPDVFEYRGRLDCWKDSGLWNRRRIWKLLDNARLGNVVFLPEVTVTWKNPDRSSELDDYDPYL